MLKVSVELCEQFLIKIEFQRDENITVSLVTIAAKEFKVKHWFKFDRHHTVNPMYLYNFIEFPSTCNYSCPSYQEKPPNYTSETSSKKFK